MSSSPAGGPPPPWSPQAAPSRSHSSEHPTGKQPPPAGTRGLAGASRLRAGSASTPCPRQRTGHQPWAALGAGDLLVPRNRHEVPVRARACPAWPRQSGTSLLGRETQGPPAAAPQPGGPHLCYSSLLPALGQARRGPRICEGSLETWRAEGQVLHKIASGGPANVGHKPHPSAALGTGSTALSALCPPAPLWGQRGAAASTLGSPGLGLAPLALPNSQAPPTQWAASLGNGTRPLTGARHWLREGNTCSPGHLFGAHTPSDRRGPRGSAPSHRPPRAHLAHRTPGVPSPRLRGEQGPGAPPEGFCFAPAPSLCIPRTCRRRDPAAALQRAHSGTHRVGGRGRRGRAQGAEQRTRAARARGPERR